MTTPQYPPTGGYPPPYGPDQDHPATIPYASGPPSPYTPPVGIPPYAAPGVSVYGAGAARANRRSPVPIVAAIIGAVVVVGGIAAAILLSRGGVNTTTGTTTTGGTGTTTTSSFPNVAGTYSGTVQNTTANETSDITLTLVQSQGQLTGNLVIAPPLVGSGPVVGTITKSGTLTFTVKNDTYGSVIDFTGTQQSDGSLSGTYTVEVTNEQGLWNAQH